MVEVRDDCEYFRRMIEKDVGQIDDPYTLLQISRFIRNVRSGRPKG